MQLLWILGQEIFDPVLKFMFSIVINIVVNLVSILKIQVSSVYKCGCVSIHVAYVSVKDT